MALGQPPALGQAWHFSGEEAGDSFTIAAKLENCFSVLPLQAEQAGALLEADRTRTSST
jgi:hypothetical protein